ncbi:hypothetical protein BZA77DRAFT_298519 [Pyronema omphalodes]|nr:hypothetical protein BZA77DRAFT_298519 [Pyronema omphalodes]
MSFFVFLFLVSIFLFLSSFSSSFSTFILFYFFSCVSFFFLFKTLFKVLCGFIADMILLLDTGYGCVKRNVYPLGVFGFSLSFSFSFSIYFFCF